MALTNHEAAFQTHYTKYTQEKIRIRKKNLACIDSATISQLAGGRGFSTFRWSVGVFGSSHSIGQPGQPSQPLFSPDAKTISIQEGREKKPIMIMFSIPNSKAGPCLGAEENNTTTHTHTHTHTHHKSNCRISIILPGGASGFCGVASLYRM